MVGEERQNGLPSLAFKLRKSPPRTLLVLALIAIAATTTTHPHHFAVAFLPLVPSAPATNRQTPQQRIASTLAATSQSDDAFDSISVLQRAREVLEKSKAKLAAQQQEEGAEGDPSNNKQTLTSPSVETTNTPFFAQRSVSRDGVVKSRDASTGLITADGEIMAAISEQEDWEIRPINEVFVNEMNENEDVYSMASQQLASRDLAASVWNLRQQLHNDDYQKIFDKRNFFIGEDN